MTSPYIVVDIRYENRNGRVYAYTSTSKRIPGRKNPVSVKEYLGAVDPKTGRIIEKRIRSEPRTFPPDGARMVDYGNALLVNRIAERIGIDTDLHDVFGDDSKGILSIALAQAIHPMSSDSIDMVLNSSYISQMLGLGKRIGKTDIRHIINSLALPDMLRFFECRRSRVDGKLYAYAHLMTDSKGASSGTGASHMDSASTILMVMSSNGIPLGFSPLGNTTYDSTGLRDILRVIGDLEECIFIADTALSPMLDIASFLRDGIEFAVPYDSSSEQFRSIQSDYTDIEHPEYGREYREDRYHLKGSDSGFLQTNGHQQMVPRSDPRFGDCTLHLKSFMCLDPRMRALAMDRMRKSVSDIRYRLDDHIFEDPDHVFRLVAGPYASVLRYGIDKDGVMRVIVRRKEMAEFNRDSGKTIVIVNSATWDDVISGRIARSRMAKVIDEYNNGSTQLRKYVGKGILTEPHLFIEFLAISIRHEMQRIIDESDIKGMDVSTALLMSSTYKAAIVDDGVIRGSRDRRLARIFKLFDVKER